MDAYSAGEGWGIELMIDEVVARGHEVTLFSSGDCVTGYTATSLDALPELVAPALALYRRKVRERAEGRFG